MSGSQHFCHNKVQIPEPKPNEGCLIFGLSVFTGKVNLFSFVTSPLFPGESFSSSLRPG